MNEQDDAVTKVLKVFPDAIPLKIVDTRWGIERFKQFVAETKWQQAKGDGYKKYAPHQYTTLGFFRNPKQELVIKAGRFVERHGVPIKFYGNKTYKIFVVDGWRYWYMANDGETNVVVNRANMADTQGLTPQAIELLSKDTEIKQ